MNHYIELFFIIISIFFTFLILNWRYGKELDLRLKWMRKRLKSGRWKMFLGIVFTLNIAIMITRLVFSNVPDDFSLKIALVSSYTMIIFSLLFFKYFYEIIGGKRPWKL
jgi:hypothetical protein